MHTCTGRVKTLHPGVHGGILAKRNDASHMAAIASHHIDPIDIVAVNLYPFRQTVKGGADFNTCVENIDIGGAISRRRVFVRGHFFL